MAPVFLKAAKAAKVPVAVHLDHGQSVETCIKAIKAGFNSVMYDGASLPFEKNVYESGLVARLAHACGVDVEAELGKVGDTGFGSGETGVSADVFTDVAEAVRFVEETEVDALAVAIGNKHGRYTSTPHLNINRLREINSAVPVPLVLHGGSGTPDDKVQEAVRNGIAKVNICTELIASFGKRLSAVQCERDFKYNVFQFFREGMIAGEKLAESKIRLFNPNSFVYQKNGR